MTPILDIHEERLRTILANANQHVALAFALCCSARLANTAHALNPYSDALVRLAKTIDALLAFLKCSKPLPSLPSDTNLLEIMPDEESHPTIAGAVLEDALAASVYTLRFCQSQDIQDIIWAGRRAYETADRLVHSTLNGTSISDGDEKYIRDHEITSRELRRQMRDLCALQEIDDMEMMLRIVARAHSEHIVADVHSLDHSSGTDAPA